MKLNIVGYCVHVDCYPKKRLIYDCDDVKCRMCKVHCEHV